jgi:hypothetical protein
MDIVFHFSTQELDLGINDTEAALSCQTIGGQALSASDSVFLVKY